MELNSEQKAAVAQRRNVVVSAGAGSGKTGVLARRYLTIIRNGESDVERILTLTFTRKAAAEMFTRIHEGLELLAAEDPRLQGQLERLERAPIATLDSFAAGILRDGAWIFGLNPDFVPDEDDLEREAERISLAFIQEESTDPAMAQLLSYYAFDEVWTGIFARLARFHIRLSSPPDFPALHRAQMDWLRTLGADVTRRVHEHLRAMAESPLDTPAVSQYRHSLTACGTNISLIGELVRGLSRGMVRAGTAEKDEFRSHLFALKGATAKDTGLVDALEEILGTLAREAEFAALSRLLDRFTARVITERQASATLSYTEIMEFAVAALRENGELRAHYKSLFDFIMIDEFQDNNAMQRDLLFILAEKADVHGTLVPEPRDLEPEKLFFVGDQKQSIYRFRGADVSVFKNLSETFPVLSLRRNYRSEPELIDFFNAFFVRVFTSPERAYEAVYEPLDARDPVDGAKPVIKLALVSPADEEGMIADERAEAVWIAGEIQQMVDTDKREYSDIAIVLKAGSNQQTYEQALRKAGIPYTTQTLRSLFLEAPAADICNFLQIVLYPDDRAAYAAVLRSPLVGVSDAGLIQILTGDQSEPFAECELDSETDAFLYAQGAGAYAQVSRMIDVRPLPSVLDYIWYDLGYRYSILSHSRYHSFLEHYDYLLDFSRQFSGRAAVEFVDALRDMLGKSARIDDVEPGSGEGVQLMTIHRSKGLQFPVVFVANCRTASKNRTELVWEHPELGLTVVLPEKTIPGQDERPVSRNVIASRAAEDERAHETAEMRRLLYVAATRAETQLIFTSVNKKTGQSLFSLIADALELNEEGTAVNAALEPFVTVEQIPPVTEDEWTHVRSFGIERKRADVQRDLLPLPVVARIAVDIDITPSGLAGAPPAAGVQPAQAAPPAQGAQPAQGAPPAEGAPPAQGAPPAGAAPPAEGALDPRVFGSLCHALIESRIAGGPDGLQSAPGAGSAPSAEAAPGAGSAPPAQSAPPAAAAPGTESAPPAGAAPPAESALMEKVAAEMLPRQTSSAAKERLFAEAREVVGAFLSSDEWRRFFAPLQRAQIRMELPFLYFFPAGEVPAGTGVVEVDENYFSGQADMVLLADDRTIVVDFKSDMEIEPERHRMQLGVYRLAMEKLYGKPVQTFLAYLRFSRIVPVDDLPGPDELRGRIGELRNV